jgi:hypothetical protein
LYFVFLFSFRVDGRDVDTIYVHDNCNKAGSPLGGHLQKKKAYEAFPFTPTMKYIMERKETKKTTILFLFFYSDILLTSS